MGVRRIPPSHQSITGVFPSLKNGGGVPFESGLERDLCYQLEFDHAVATYEAQPVAITYVRPSGRKCTGYPDFLIHYKPESARRDEIHDVKPRSKIRKDWAHLRPRLLAACQYARSQGKIYRLTSEVEIRDSFLPQFKFLYRFLCNPPDNDLLRRVIDAMHALGSTTPAKLLDLHFSRDEDPAYALPALWHLVAARNVAADLTRPLTMNSLISAGPFA